jgi:hypothetical protein
MADCYDWSFLFSLILKSQTMITQVINAIRVQDLSTQMFALQRGLVELETWTDSEWFVFSIGNYIHLFEYFLARDINPYYYLYVIKHKH